jgi:hypothetical protein
MSKVVGMWRRQKTKKTMVFFALDLQLHINNKSKTYSSGQTINLKLSRFGALGRVHWQGFFVHFLSFIPLILYCPPHYVSAPSTGKIFAFSFFVFFTPVIRDATSPPPAQPSIMPSVFPNTDWACETCTHPNKQGKTCMTYHLD